MTGKAKRVQIALEFNLEAVWPVTAVKHGSNGGDTWCGSTDAL
jgi:hypothetical protein